MFQLKVTLLDHCYIANKQKITTETIISLALFK